MSPTLPVDGHDLRLTNLDKPFYPEAGWTKGDVVAYYTRIAPVLLPHLAGRPLVLKRYPDGVDGDHFYQKQCPQHRPEWLATVPMRSDSQDRTVHYCSVDNLAGLLWLANTADLEIHALLWTDRQPQRPTALVFDLDPGPGAGIPECARLALRLHHRLAEDGLQVWPKTSGGKGLQLYAPLDGASSFEQTRAYARRVAVQMAHADPRRVTATMRKAERPGRVYTDWAQNAAHKSTVSVYSLRARRRPIVSTPITWEETRAAAHGAPLVFDADLTLERVQRHGDLFLPVLQRSQTLPSPEEP